MNADHFDINGGLHWVQRVSSFGQNPYQFDSSDSSGCLSRVSDVEGSVGVEYHVYVMSRIEP